MLRLYQPDELGPDGYPVAWHRCQRCTGTGWVCDECGGPHAGGCAACENPLASGSGCPDCHVSGECAGSGSIKAMVRAAAGHRCIRCGHPYRTGEHGDGEWTPCDDECRHAGPVRYGPLGREFDASDKPAGILSAFALSTPVEARWRILTVHHLDGDKANCRWWNLAALCQRCHLQIQGKVLMERVWPWEHSEWFQPYVAGYYAQVYEHREVAREEAEADMARLLSLERQA